MRRRWIHIRRCYTREKASDHPNLWKKLRNQKRRTRVAVQFASAITGNRRWWEWCLIAVTCSTRLVSTNGFAATPHAPSAELLQISTPLCQKNPLSPLFHNPRSFIWEFRKWSIWEIDDHPFVYTVSSNGIFSSFLVCVAFVLSVRWRLAIDLYVNFNELIVLPIRFDWGCTSLPSSSSTHASTTLVNKEFTGSSPHASQHDHPMTCPTLYPSGQTTISLTWPTFPPIHIKMKVITFKFVVDSEVDTRFY